MLKHRKVRTGVFLLAACMLLLVLPLFSGSTQLLSPDQGATASSQTRDLKQSSSEPFVKDFQTDDAYEPNDDRTSAYDLSNDERTWLSTIDGHGIQWDDDWYRIYVSSGNSHLNVELTFTHSLGDIDIRVTDNAGSTVASSTGVSDNEDISVDVSTGYYYLRIYYDDAGNAYDLWWDDSTSGTTPTTGFPGPFFFLIFFIVGIAAFVIIIVVVIVCVVVIVRRTSSPRRPPIRRPVPARPSTRRRTTTESAKTRPKPSPATPTGPTIKCANCGSFIEPADKFCVGCGQEVD